MKKNYYVKESLLSNGQPIVQVKLSTEAHDSEVSQMRDFFISDSCSIMVLLRGFSYIKTIWRFGVETSAFLYVGYNTEMSRLLTFSITNYDNYEHF